MIKYNHEHKTDSHSRLEREASVSSIGTQTCRLAHEDIADALGVSTRAVSRWMKAVREEGKAGLEGRPHVGAPPKLSPADLALLPELLAEGAEAYGFRGEVWTCARVATVIKREFGLAYHKNHVSYQVALNRVLSYKGIYMSRRGLAWRGYVR